MSNKYLQRIKFTKICFLKILIEKNYVLLFKESYCLRLCLILKVT